MLKKSLGLLFLATAIFATRAEAPKIVRLDGTTITPSEIDGTVSRLMKAAEVPGLSVAIFSHGRVAYLKSYGFRDTERKLPLTPSSVVSGASFTKAAFAYMVMQLVEEKLLDLDKPVYQYLPKPLPEYPNYSDLTGDPRYKLITARMLLSHTSGFANWRSLEDDRKLKIHFQPGSRYAYSGEGIVLLQLVVESVTRKPLELLMRERVFQPLGMIRTSMVWQKRFEGDYANGYDEYGRSLGPQKRKTADAAGSMLTTISDFARFMQAVMQGRGLKKTAREQMLTPQVQINATRQFPTMTIETTEDYKQIRLSYGLGWGLYLSPYGKVFFKEGHDDGWRNYTVCFDQPKSGIVIMSNSGNAEGVFKELLETLLRNTFTPIDWEGYTPYNRLRPRPPLPQHKVAHVESAVLDTYVGRYGLPPNIILVIRREGDHLSVQEKDEPKQELQPQSETVFFSTVADDVYSFESDAKGHATRMILHTGGKDIPIDRINSTKP